MNDEEIRIEAMRLSIELSGIISERTMDMVKTFALEAGITLTEDQELVVEAATNAAYGVTMLLLEERGMLA